jgi:hypothetical protein
MAVFEPYHVPTTTTAAAFRDLDADISQIGVLRRENEGLRRQEQKLRRAAANALACAEAERAESARLRAENQRLAAELATANAYRNAGRESL